MSHRIDRRTFVGSTISGIAGLGFARTALAQHDVQAESEPAENSNATSSPPADDDVNIAFLQIDSVGKDLEENRKKGHDYCRRANALGCDIALFPEMFSIGYNGFWSRNEQVKKDWQALAVPKDGEWVQSFSALADELNIAIGITYLMKDVGDPRNVLTLFDRHGNELFTYTKMHTCDFLPFEASTAPGEDVFVADLDTEKGKIKTGAMICYDREFPEAARMNMLKGAELVLVPNACELDEPRIAQFMARAFENSMVMAMTNYPGTKRFMNGHSVAFDAAGVKLQDAPKEEGIYNARFSLGELRKFRSTSIWGNSFRRPHRYSALTEFHDIPEFKRKNFFGAPFVASKR